MIEINGDYANDFLRGVLTRINIVLAYWGLLRGQLGRQFPGKFQCQFCGQFDDQFWGQFCNHFLGQFEINFIANAHYGGSF